MAARRPPQFAGESRKMRDKIRRQKTEYRIQESGGAGS
jgi:hypothetical protein